MRQITTQSSGLSGRTAKYKINNGEQTIVKNEAYLAAKSTLKPTKCRNFKLGHSARLTVANMDIGERYVWTDS